MGAYEQGLLATIGINSILGLSVYCILATGQLSLGNAGFMAVGAYVYAWLVVQTGIPMVLAMLIAAGCCLIAGLAVGIPALRFKGIYLAVGTLAFGEVVRTVALNFDAIGGTSGFSGMQGVSAGFIWVVVGIVFAGVAILQRGRWGQQAKAVRDDDYAAEVVGIDTVFVKVAAFGIGALCAGIGGALFAEYTLFIEPNNFGWLVSIDMVLFVVLGGSRSLWGPIIGAAVLTLLPEVLRPIADWRLAFYGGILVIILIVRPHGLIGPVRLSRFLRRRNPAGAERS